MKKKLVCFLMVIGVLVCLGVTNGALGAGKGFPAKPIELVCPWGAGGSTSMGGRVIAGALSEFIGVPAVLKHKTGAGGTIAATYVAKSKPDGYTLLIFNSATNGIIPAIRKIEYSNSDFEVLAQYAIQPLALTVSKDAPWKTLQELVEDAKKRPGELKFATPGLGTSSHFSMELFKLAAGRLKIDHIPFKSGTKCIAAIMGGHVHMGLMYMVGVKGSYEAGRVRLLAVATEKRLKGYPKIPTFVELGYPDVKMTAWYGIATRAGAPKEVSDKLKDALYKTIENKDVNRLLSKIGYFPVFRKAEEFAEFVSKEEKKFSRIAKEAKIKLD
jgi:tripartite-type tricarboxylate transporter receptor subunit TctC